MDQKTIAERIALLEGGHIMLDNPFTRAELLEVYRMAASCARPEEQRIQEAFAAAFCNMDENGDPVGAEPEGPWETGYAAGLRTVYRMLKARGITLPSSQPQNNEGKP